METVCEQPNTLQPTAPVLPEPNENGEAMDTVGEMPPPTLGVRRLKSSASVRSKPISRGGSIQRTTSMRAQRPGAPAPSASSRSRGGVRRAPSRNYSSQSLRPYGSGHSNLQRGESEVSLGDYSSGSAFTMDSVALRKGQLIADPVDGGTYCEDESFADHESFMTRDDFTPLAEAKGPMVRESNVVAMGDFVNLNERQVIPEGEVEDDTVSYMTGTSALTNDFTDLNDESEYEATETDYAE